MRRAGFFVLISLPFVVVLAVATVSHKLESKFLWGRTNDRDAYRAAVSYMKNSPDFRGANFSAQRESVIERWGPSRFHIAGKVDLQAAGGATIHNSYSCVLRYNGSDRWEVEDLRVERVE